MDGKKQGGGWRRRDGQIGFGGRQDEKTRIMCLPEREGMHLSRRVNIVDSLLILLFMARHQTMSSLS